VDPLRATRFPAKIPVLFDLYEGPFVTPPVYGNDLQVGRRRVPTCPNNALEMDRVTSNRIDLAAIVRDYPAEAAVVRTILDPEEFRARFKPEQDPLAGINVPPTAARANPPRLHAEARGGGAESTLIDDRSKPAAEYMSTIPPTASLSQQQQRAAARCEAAKLRQLRREKAHAALAAEDAATPPVKLIIIRPISRGMFRQRQSLLAFDTAEDAPDARQIYTMKVFLTPKKNGKGRLVVDCRRLNDCMEAPGDMGLPVMGELIRKILGWNYAAQSDAVSYFYQFEVHPGIRDYFRVRLGGQRGYIAEMRMKRMAMGWKYAPRIAQTVANILVQEDGAAWVDNFFVGGTTLGEFTTRRKAFLERVKRYNVEVDDTEMLPQSTLLALGLEFDLEKKVYRLDPAWVAKRVELLTSDTQTTRSYREWYQIYGALVWASYVLEKPLYAHAEALAALSSLAKEVGGRWEDPAALPSYAQKDLADWSTEVREAGTEWVAPTRPMDESVVNESWGSMDPLQHPDSPHAKKLVFNDSSGDAAAWAAVVDGLIVDGQQWKRNGGEDIFLGELDALLTAYEANSPTDRYITDNRGLHCVARAGHSSSYEANCRLRRRAKGRWIRTWWTPTRKMLVDPFTRELKLPSFPTPAADWVVPDDDERDLATQTKPSACVFLPSWKVKPWDQQIKQW
jgi:hypothetical protein